MKKANILNLIKYHYEQDEDAFKSEALEIAADFASKGDTQLQQFILTQIANTNISDPPTFASSRLQFLERVDLAEDGHPFPIPTAIERDLQGLINGTRYQAQTRIHKFLFEGAPGTGKTESVKHLARILNRDLFMVRISALVDSKLGKTAQNIDQLFKEINYQLLPERSIVLFDEIDALALDRMNIKDNREMGRATTAVLKGLDALDERVLLIATSNLYEHFDTALLRRFSYVINFNKYSKEDLVEIAETIFNYHMTHTFKHLSKDSRLFKKIISLMEPLKYPGDLKNLIISSLAFSDPDYKYDYLGIIYKAVTNHQTIDPQTLKQEGFSVREIEKITGVSKSKASQDLQPKSN